MLLYSRYLHAKLSWDLIVADIDKTWTVNNIDNICRQFIRRWLEIPPSGTLDLILLSREKFGLEVALCQYKVTTVSSYGSKMSQILTERRYSAVGRHGRCKNKAIR